MDGGSIALGIRTWASDLGISHIDIDGRQVKCHSEASAPMQGVKSFIHMFGHS